MRWKSNVVFRSFCERCDEGTYFLSMRKRRAECQSCLTVYTVNGRPTMVKQYLSVFKKKRG